MADARSIVASFLRRGFRLVYFERTAKGPHVDGWTSWSHRLEHYQDGMNVGTFTGHEIAPGRFLADVDFDWAEGLHLAKRILPRTAFAFGRTSRHVSHAFYTTSTPIASVEYADLDGQNLVELRGTKLDGSVGLQTMLPPSNHPPTGETVTLRMDGELGNDDNLPRLVRNYAIACLLYRHLGPRGLGHDTRLAVAGFLLREGVDEPEVVAIGEAIAAAAGNSVDDVRLTVRSTAARLETDDRVSGSGVLAEAIGDNGKKVVALVRRWLGRDELILNPGDPLRVARIHVERFHTIDGFAAVRHQAGVFYVYRADASAYHDREQDAVRADLYRFLEPAKTANKNGELSAFQPTKAKVENVLDALRAVANLPKSMAAPCWLENSPGLNPVEMLAFTNGLLHVPTRTLLPPTPTFFTLNGLEFAYNAEAPPPMRWLTFLRELWPDDDESIAALQEWIGYLLTPDTRFQKIGMLVGPKRSGKGTIARILRRLLGERNVCGPTLANMSEQHGLAVLIGKTAAIIADARITGRTDTGVITERLLSISGEDPLSVPRKYLPDWDGRLFVRFFLLTNELPRIEDSSGALASRFLLLQLTQSFYGREDHALLERLSPELPGILNWALEGRDRLYQRGHFVTPQSSLDLVQQFESLGSPIGVFLRDCCLVQQGCTVPQADLFAAWQMWCGLNGRDKPGTAQSFGRNLHSAVPWVKETRPRGDDGSRVRYYEGIGLLATPEREEDHARLPM